MAVTSNNRALIWRDRRRGPALTGGFATVPTTGKAGVGGQFKIKTAPQQTITDRWFTTARNPLTNPSSPAQAGHLARFRST